VLALAAMLLPDKCLFFVRMRMLFFAASRVRRHGWQLSKADAPALSGGMERQARYKACVKCCLFPEKPWIKIVD